MLDGFSLPVTRATKHFCPLPCFVDLKKLFHHTLLREEEKILWLWLAIQSAGNDHQSCSFTYEQISRQVGQSLRLVHRSLFRLKIMGFLQAAIPIWYSEPTVEMGQELRCLKPILPKNMT
jgi:hypothetical protein